MRALVLLLVIAGCDPDGEKADDTSVADDTSPADDTGGGPCGESGICPLTVTEATGECGDDTPGTAPSLTAAADGPGAVRLVVENALVGCCPTVEAEGEASQRSGEITVNWWVAGDDCDCVCSLDVTVRVEGVPPGEWTLVTAGLSAAVTVE